MSMQQISAPQQTEAPSPRLLVIGLDCFWKEIDARHPHYRPGSPSANAIREYYRYIYDVAPTLLSLLDQPVPPSMIGTPRAL